MRVDGNNDNNLGAPTRRVYGSLLPVKVTGSVRKTPPPKKVTVSRFKGQPVSRLPSLSVINEDPQYGGSRKKTKKNSPRRTNRKRSNKKRSNKK